MLVLSRYKNEKVQIGNDITVKILSIEDGKVRLGFDAPKEIPILRCELIADEIETTIYESSQGGTT